MKQILIGIFVVWPGIICHAQNQNISNGNVFDGEPYLAVNPANPQHMVVAWMSYVFPGIAIRTRATFDGGRTWGAVQVIPHTNPLYDGADPSLDFDNAGNLFLAFVDFDESAKTGAVVVVKSTDGGRTWGAPVEVINAAADVQKPIDRPWIAVDRSGGPHDGTIYVTTMPPTVFGYLPPPSRPSDSYSLSLSLSSSLARLHYPPGFSSLTLSKQLISSVKPKFYRFLSLHFSLNDTLPLRPVLPK